LLQDLPQTLNIGGFEVNINYDFKTSIKFNELTKGKEKLDNEDIWQALCLYYPVLKNTTDNSSIAEKELFIHIKDNLQEAVDKMFWFYGCGKDIKESNHSEGKSPLEIFSYEYDSDYIYTALLGQFGINLSKERDLHWWSFKAMLNSLSEDTELRQRMKFRAADITKVPKEQQEYYRKMKKIYEIPRDKEEVKQNSGLAALLRGGKTLDNLKE
jgi:hypothetical protein